MKKVENQSKTELVANLTAKLQDAQLYVKTKRSNEEVLELLNECLSLTQVIYSAM